MDQLPELFVRARNEIEPIISTVGFRLASLRFDPESFGSAFAEYSRRGSRFRLVWDGKEAALSAEVQLEDGSWSDIETSIGDSPKTFQTDSSNEHVQRLASAVRRFCTGG